MRAHTQNIPRFKTMTFSRLYFILTALVLLENTKKKGEDFLRKKYPKTKFYSIILIE